MKNANSKKIILDLCGGTGSWSKPYADAGYTVVNVTLPIADVRTHHFINYPTRRDLCFNPTMQNRAMTALAVPAERIHGVLAAPPCTVFSKADWRRPASARDFTEGLETLTACLDIIHELQRVGAPLAWWAIENPQSHTRKFLGHPPLTFAPWQFGERSPVSATKRTDLWGYYAMPAMTTRRRPKQITATRHSKPEWYNPPVPEELKHLPFDARRAAIRAMTSPAFAQAFFKANP